MAETAAHFSDQVFPRVAVRQLTPGMGCSRSMQGQLPRELSLRKRLRYHLERDPNVANPVLHIFLRVVQAHLRQQCPEASERARFGAVIFSIGLFTPSLGLIPSGPRYGRRYTLLANLSARRSTFTCISTAA